MSVCFTCCCLQELCATSNGKAVYLVRVYLLMPKLCWGSQWIQVIMLVGCHLYDDAICFATAFLESIPSTPLNWFLWNFNTGCVSVGNRTLQRDFFGYWAPKKFGPQNYLFATTLQLWGPISPIRNMIWTIGKLYWNWEAFPTLSQNFMNFGPLTEKIGL